MIDSSFWTSTENHCLLNPRLSESDQQRIQQAVQSQGGQSLIWLKSSGTESYQKGHKLVALKKSALLAGAKATADFLKLTDKDCWLNPLPLFHVGGLAILARSQFSGCSVPALGSWNLLRFIEVIEQESVTASSLVPTQVFDLVKSKIPCPSTLRFILVGGGALSEDLYLQARQLGWPLLPSYGMTETSAMMACASLQSLEQNSYPKMLSLPHLNWSIVDGRVGLTGESLYQGFLWVTDSEAQWQQRPDPFFPDDHIVYNGSEIEVLGRSSDLVKILGETVNLQDLTQRLQPLFHGEIAIAAKPHERKGFELYLFEEAKQLSQNIEQVNSQVMPFERLTELKALETFPRSELGKVQKNKLLNNL